MHPSSFENMQRCIEWYGAKGSIKVADIGAIDVNGTYKGLFADDVSYIGLDLEPGKNVDIVQDDPYVLPLGDGSIDVVISGQMLEHCPQFWRVFGEVARVLADEGLAFMIAPSAGAIHRYPVDCYRFYPDAWQAMADWSGLRLVHCWLDERGPWRDLVGVFQKGGAIQKIAGPVVHAAEPLAPIRGTDPATEVIAGARNYREVLATLHEIVAPGLYCEIGVRTGGSLALSTGATIAVDPTPELAAVPENVALHTCTSDDFFFFKAEEAIRAPIDLAFIDGMHLCEYVYRDFMNLERRMSPSGVIVIDDVLPNHALQAARTRQTRVWTGDVWKFAAFLAETRPDLQLTLLDTSPSGLLVISRLSPGNALLRDSYNPLVRRLWAMENTSAPDSVIRREGAIDPTPDAIRRAAGR